MASSRTPIRILAPAAALVIAAGLSGCVFQDPSPRQDELEAVNLGTNADVGGVEFDNLLVVTRAEGDPARLMGVLLNSTSEDVDVTIADDDDSTSLTLEPGQQFAFHENPTVFDTADGRPGSRTELVLTVGDDSEAAPVPVRNGSLDWLERYLPAA